MNYVAVFFYKSIAAICEFVKMLIDETEVYQELNVDTLFNK